MIFLKQKNCLTFLKHSQFFLKCFHSLIMNICILMLNQMHQKQDVINAPCVAAYDKSEVKKKKFLDHQDVELIKWNISHICFELLGQSPGPYLQPCSPVVLFFNGKYGFQMSTGSLRREAKHQWKTRGMSVQIHQLHVCQLLLIQMFYALVEHFCTQKHFKKKLLTGMFVQNFPVF